MYKDLKTLGFLKQFELMTKSISQYTQVVDQFMPKDPTGTMAAQAVASQLVPRGVFEDLIPKSVRDQTRLLEKVGAISTHAALMRSVQDVLGIAKAVGQTSLLGKGPHQKLLGLGFQKELLGEFGLARSVKSVSETFAWPDRLAGSAVATVERLDAVTRIYSLLPLPARAFDLIGEIDRQTAVVLGVSRAVRGVESWMPLGPALAAVASTIEEQLEEGEEHFIGKLLEVLAGLRQRLASVGREHKELLLTVFSVVASLLLSMSTTAQLEGYEAAARQRQRALLDELRLAADNRERLERELEDAQETAVQNTELLRALQEQLDTIAVDFISVVQRKAKLRARGSSQGRVIGSVSAGEQVVLLRLSGRWALVEVHRGERTTLGWIPKKALVRHLRAPLIRE